MGYLFEKSHTTPLYSAHGEIVYELIGSTPEHGGTTAHSLAYIIIPFNKASLKHYHKVCEESYYLLKGQARMILDDQEFTASPGQAILVLPGQRHQIFNAGDDDLEFLAICAPAWNPKDSYLE